MNILFVVSEYLPVDNAVSIRTQYNARALRENGFDVNILTGALSKDLTDSEIPVACVRSKPPSNKSGFVKRLIEELRFGLDLAFYIIKSRRYSHIVITSPPFFMSNICAIACRMKRISYSIDVRDRYPQVFFSLGILNKNGLIGRILRSMEIHLYKKAHTVFTVTEGLLTHLKEITPKDNLFLAMNGYTDLSHPTQEESDGKLVRVIMHGNFGKFFDLDVFVKIAKQLPELVSNYLISIIGSGSKLDTLKDLELPNVEILDEMPHDQVVEHLADSHIGLSIHTSDESMKHAFPVKVFEFIGLELPSVVIPRNEAGKVLNKEKLGYSYDAVDWESALKTLGSLIRDKEMREKISRNISDNKMVYSRKVQAEHFAHIISTRVGI